MTKLERLNELYSDPKMTKKLNAAPTEEDLRVMLAENGVDLTPEEMSGVLEELAVLAEESVNDDELNEEQLENVSGGFTLTFASITLKTTGAVTAAFGIGAGVGLGIGLAGLAVYAIGKKKKWW